jgi:hypothetical protein
VIDELEDAPQLHAEEAIRQARKRVHGGDVYLLCTSEARSRTGDQSPIAP